MPIRNEIEQASRCLAFEFSTAVVFHLMRGMEGAVRRMGNHLGATFADDADWGTVLSAIDKKIEEMPKGMERTRWSESKKNLWHVKEALRNEVMHPRKEGYTQKQAEENFEAVKTFMMHIAGLIAPPEPKAATPAPTSGKPTPQRRGTE